MRESASRLSEKQGTRSQNHVFCRRGLEMRHAPSNCRGPPTGAAFGGGLRRLTVA